MSDIRACFVPRPGFVFIDTDYAQLELWSLAQVCLDLFGHSKLAEALNAGMDPHTNMAATILGISIEEAVKRKKNPDDTEFLMARQCGKVGNFGLPTGLGPPKLVHFAKKSYSTVISLELAQQIKQTWRNTWPEMREFHEHVGSLADPNTGFIAIELPRTHMVQGGLLFTEACAGYYQGLGAAAAKKAGWLIAKACYVDRSSPLFGSRPVNFVHDQWITETPEGPKAHDAAMEQARLMREGARMVMPDCVPPVEPALARYWSKSAKPVFENERLVPWG